MSDNKFNKYLERYDKLSKYLDDAINEASYTPVIHSDLEEADELPEEIYGGKINEVGEEDEEKNQQDIPPENLGAPPPEGVAPEMGDMGAPSEPEGGLEGMVDAQPPTDATPPEGDQPTDADVDLQATPVEPTEPEMMGGEVPQQPTKDEVQNDIIKLQLGAMQKMHGKLDDLEQQFQQFQQQMSEFGKDVEEVREPSNEEKLANKKMDSYPFKYNLNDLWKDNWFMSRQDQYQDQGESLPKGVTKLDDDTYIADLDSFPELTDKEIDNSFNF